MGLPFLFVLKYCIFGIAGTKHFSGFFRENRK